MSNPNWDGHILHGPNVPLYVHGAFNPQYGPELFFFSFLFHSMTLFLDILLMKTSEWPLAARGAASDKSGRERANAPEPLHSFEPLVVVSSGRACSVVGDVSHSAAFVRIRQE